MIKSGPEDEILMIQKGITSIVKEVGCFCPKIKPGKKLINGEIGYVIANIKNVLDVR